MVDLDAYAAQLIEAEADYQREIQRMVNQHRREFVRQRNETMRNIEMMEYVRMLVSIWPRCLQGAEAKAANAEAKRLARHKVERVWSR